MRWHAVRAAVARLAALTVLAAIVVAGGSARAAVSFDFRTGEGARGWTALNDLAPLTHGSEGMVARITGADPYLAGPARDYPEGTLWWLNLRLRSEVGGTGQVFHFREGRGPTEPDSVRFAVRAGDWVEVRVPLPALGAGYRLRLDPPGERGVCVVERLWIEERVRYADPEWPGAVAPEVGDGDPEVRSGEVRLVHGRGQWGGFAIEVAGRREAVGQSRPLLGYLSDGKARWWAFAEGTPAGVRGVGRGVESVLEAEDPDGGRWRWRQVFEPGRGDGVIRVRTTLSVDRERVVLHWMPLLVLTGMGEGSGKRQALLAGVEYLEDEPSSSEADLEGPQSRRQVPDTIKLTFPLAAVVRGERYVGLSWRMAPEVGVFFDSPDRVFGSGGHAMGLVVPGSDGTLRDEGSLVPYEGWRIPAGGTIEVEAELLGGRGTDGVAVVRHYARLNAWPEVPETGVALGDYARWMARGWLESGLREGDLYRHAVVGEFRPQPAADAAWWMEWLAGRVEEAGWASRLRTAAEGAWSRVEPAARHASGVGHVKTPVGALVAGGVADNAEHAIRRGWSLLRRFEGVGTVWYRPSPGGLDYGRTHWTNEASGLTAQVLVEVLEAAAFGGDRGLAAEGLRHLRGLEKFRGTVPRGAQTWEIPLHTPDILASAHLVRAYCLGYEWTGEAAFLEEARYWAWTGVPFVYLHPPTDGPVGLYATIPVLGATQWVAPNWIGLPVQWCGLVYADALQRLVRHDPDGPWERLADGIVASGIQQTYPETDPDYPGLLPDAFSLRAQQRNPANINPATLMVPAARHLGGGPVYDARRFGGHGVWVHAAGEIGEAREDADRFGFRVRGWAEGSHWVLMTGVYGPVTVRLDGDEVSWGGVHTHDRAAGRLIIEVRGQPRIEVESRR
ncbi:MAG: hypothetical protein KF833_08370 [Verrucomicrobiae bacterium]|nr:hypothetical protein [Verrucomicrobiae bacterium]